MTAERWILGWAAGVLIGLIVASVGAVMDGFAIGVAFGWVGGLAVAALCWVVFGD